MKRINFLKMLQPIVLAAMLLSGCVSVMAQQPPTKAQAPPRTSPSLYGGATNAAGAVKLPSGTITGYVYWQMSTLQPVADCQGLTVKVVTVDSHGMPQQLLSTTSSLAANGPMTDYSATGTPKYMLCSYSFQNMAEKVSLRPLLYGMPTTATVATPAAFQIPGGSCNSSTSSTLSFILTGGPVLCGDGAYNINFKLTLPPPSFERSPERSVLIPSAGSAPHGLLSQPATPNSNISGTDRSATRGVTLLSSGPGTGSPTASQSNNGTLLKDGGHGNSLATSQARPSAAGTTPGSTRQALTNADVLKMLKGGVPESVILSSIQSAAHTFDFSPASCQALTGAHATRQVLDAMGDGSVHPCPSVLMDPHSGVSDKTRTLPIEQKTLLVSQTSGTAPDGKAQDPRTLQLLQTPGAGKPGPVVKRPQVARENAAIIAVLGKQRNVADVEVAQMKLRIQPAIVAGGQSQLMSATGSAGTSGPTPAAGPTLSPGAGSTGKIPSSILHAPNISTLAVTCANNPAFRVLNVSGSAGAATFTPIDQYNLYTITGCSFGDAMGKAYIYGTGSFQQNFNVKFWSENSIVVSLDSNLSGVPDYDNITLVVQRNDSQQTQKPGFKFYAARQTVPMKQIPQSWVQLENVLTDRSNTPATAQYSSPPSSPYGSTGTSYVSRSDNGAKFTSAVGNDYYDFSQMAPGFTTDSFQVTTYPQNCPYTVTYRQDFFQWKWDWDVNNIYVSIAATTCSGFFAGMPLQNYQNWTGSYYMLQVWVNGPRGLDPVTNQPVSQ